jgi:hypothetical protein
MFSSISSGGVPTILRRTCDRSRWRRTPTNRGAGSTLSEGEGIRPRTRSGGTLKPCFVMHAPCTYLSIPSCRPCITFYITGPTAQALSSKAQRLHRAIRKNSMRVSKLLVRYSGVMSMCRQWLFVARLGLLVKLEACCCLAPCLKFPSPSASAEDC